MTTKTMNNTLGDLVKFEEDSHYSREKVTLYQASGASVSYLIGQVLSRGSTGLSIGSSADADNTGDGTLSAVALGPKARKGRYVLKCVKTATDGGEFSVYGPDGDMIGNATVGTAFETAEIEVTIGDGAADFAAGDAFYIDVAGTEKFKAIDFADPDYTDGICVLAEDIDVATATDTEAVAIVRHAKLASSGLVWPSGATAAQKALGIASLKERGLVVVDDA